MITRFDFSGGKDADSSDQGHENAGVLQRV